MTALRNITAANFELLTLSYALKLLAFVKRHSEGNSGGVSQEDVNALAKSEHPMIRAFRNRDMAKFRKIASYFKKIDLYDQDRDRIATYFRNFSTSLRDVDISDYEEAWNFFAGGLDVFLERIEEVLTNRIQMEHVVTMKNVVQTCHRTVVTAADSNLEGDIVFFFPTGDLSGIQRVVRNA